MSFHKYLVLSMLFLMLTTSKTSVADGNAHSEGLTTVSVVANNLYLLGTFDEYTADYVISELKKNPQVNRIVLTANGGSINEQETLRLGRYIRSLNLDTHLIKGGVAASGGVSLLLSGVKRSVGQDGLVGVHAWASCSDIEQTCRPATDFKRDDRAHDLHRDYILEMLGEDDFYWYSIEAAAHDTIHWLNKSELKRFKVINYELKSSMSIPFQSQFDAEYKQTCHNCPSAAD